MKTPQEICDKAVSIVNIFGFRPCHFGIYCDKNGEDLRRNDFKIFFNGDISPLTGLLYEELYNAGADHKYGRYKLDNNGNWRLVYGYEL